MNYVIQNHTQVCEVTKDGLVAIAECSSAENAQLVRDALGYFENPWTLVSLEETETLA